MLLPSHALCDLENGISVLPKGLEISISPSPRRLDHIQGRGYAKHGQKWTDLLECTNQLLVVDCLHRISVEQRLQQSELLNRIRNTSVQAPDFEDLLFNFALLLLHEIEEVIYQCLKWRSQDNNRQLERFLIFSLLSMSDPNSTPYSDRRTQYRSDDGSKSLDRTAANDEVEYQNSDTSAEQKCNDGPWMCVKPGSRLGYVSQKQSSERTDVTSQHIFHPLLAQSILREGQ